MSFEMVSRKGVSFSVGQYISISVHQFFNFLSLNHNKLLSITINYNPTNPQAPNNNLQIFVIVNHIIPPNFDKYLEFFI